MGYLRKKFVALSLVVFSTIMLFYGCDTNKYKNLKLEVSETDLEIVLDERPENNVFSISAQVSKMPKGYNGGVSFSVPVNDFISVINGNPEVRDGKSIGIFEAKKQGGPVDIIVRTLEGGLSKKVTVRVVKPITSLAFNTTNIPIVKGEKTDISNFITFNPEGTSQNAIKLELSSDNPSDQLIRIVTDGKYLTVPNDLDISQFRIRARSQVNEELVTDLVNAKVVTVIPVSQIALMHDNDTPNTTEDDLALQKNSNGEYILTLATNTSNLFSKTLYFNFNNILNENDNYTVSVKGLTESGSIVGEDGVVNAVTEVDVMPNAKNMFRVNAMGNGRSRIEFIIKRADFPNYAPFEQSIVLNVNVEAFPTTISVTNGSDNATLDKIKLFANYDGTNLFGTPFKIVVSNETGEMTNQKVVLSLNAGAENIQLYDRFKNPMEFDVSVAAGQVYYLTHSFTTVPTENISLSIISSTYNEVFLNVPIEIETQPIVLSTSQPTVHIDVTKPEVNTPLVIEGLSITYDLRLLKVELIKNENSDASALLNLIQSPTQIALSPKGNIGECLVSVIAENGSQITFTIILFESLSVENSSITIAGTEVVAKEALGGITPKISIRNGLNIPIRFKINGKVYTSLNGTGLIYNAVSNNTQVVQIKANYQIQSQSMAGDAHIEIQVLGFNEAGEQAKIVYFELDVNVSVPLETLSVGTKEIVLYDLNTLSSNQITLNGTHEIILASSPRNASFDYSDIEWVCEYNGSELYFSKNESGDSIIYQFSTNRFDIITLTTSKSNFKRATVTCSISSASASNLIFNIVARIQQKFTNEEGSEISSPKSVSIRFLVNKAEKVEHVVFENVSVFNKLNSEYYEIVFDERELGYDGSGYSNTQNATREISFNVYPSTALYKDLGVKINNSSVAVKVNNITKTITVTVLTKLLGNDEVILTVYPLDDVEAGVIGTYKEIKIRVLDGTEGNPFEVGSEEDLKRINTAMNSHYVLTSNIAISSWTPIGYSENGVLQFNGSLSGKKVIEFNGQVIQTSYYTISGMSIVNKNEMSYFGLFAYLGSNSTISDLTLNNFLISVNIPDNHKSNIFVGALAGFSEGKIINVTVNDLSGVQSYNGNYYNGVQPGIVPESGIYVTSNTSSDEKSYYFVGGLVGLINNAQLHNNGAVQEINNFALKGEPKAGATNELINLKSNYPNKYDQIVNANVAAQINVQVKTHNISFVGGIAGFNNRAVITADESNDISFGDESSHVFVAINAQIGRDQIIHNTNSAFGGVVGFNNGIVENIKTKASIFGVYDRNDGDPYMSNVGGVVGYNVGTVENTTSYPLIRGHRNVGGIIGRSENAVVMLQNTLSSEKKSYVNGKPGVGEAFTMFDAINFNKNFQIAIQKFENITLSYDEIVDLFATEFYAGEEDAKVKAEENIKTYYGVHDNVYVDKYILPENFTILKITKSDLLGSRLETEYATRIGNETSISTNLCFYNQFTTADIALGLSEYGSNVVRNNKVEFLDNEDSLTTYNTAIIGLQNVGGIVGTYEGLFGLSNNEKFYNLDNEITAVAVSRNYVNYNPFEFNTVYNYSKENVKTVGSDGRGFFGNIMLSNSHTNEVSLKNRNFAGGLIGNLINGSVTTSQVFASIQGNLAGIGGLVGRAQGITQISNSSFVGILLNRRESGSVVDVNPATGGLIGDALNAVTTFAYYGEFQTSSNQPLHRFASSNIAVYDVDRTNFNNVAKHSALNSSYNNISHSYYRAQDLNNNYIENNVASDNAYVKSVGFVGDGTKDINFVFKYFESGSLKTKTFGDENTPYITINSDILSVNQTTHMKCERGVTAEESNIIEQNLLEKSLAINAVVSSADYNTFVTQVNAYVISTGVDALGNAIDGNADGIKDADSGLDYSVSKEKFIENNLANTVWYINYQVNNGLPVLLSEQKAEYVDSTNETNTDETNKEYRISLLANFPPTNILVDNNQNYVDSFVAGIDDNKASVIYYYGLNDNNYVTGGTNINFGNNNADFDEDAIKNFTNTLNSEITGLNTYSIEQILRLTSVPSFVRGNSFKITSSNSNVLGVELDSNNTIKFVAKSAGEVTVTITSAYNKDIFKTIKVNVVNSTQKMDLSYFSSGNKKTIEYGSTLNLKKSTDNNQVTLPINTNLSSSYNFISGSRVNRNFDLYSNANSGVRYYLLSKVTSEGKEHSSIYHANNDIEGLIKGLNFNINSAKFSYDLVGQIEVGGTLTNYYTIYVDVAYGNSANFVGLKESEQELLAVPYILAKNKLGVNQKILLANTAGYESFVEVEHDSQRNNGKETSRIYGFKVPTFEDVKNTGISKEEYDENYVNEYKELLSNLITKFNIKISSASWELSKSTNSITFSVYNTPTFNIEIKTDKQKEELYVSYFDVEEKIISVSTIKEKYNSELQIGDITLLVNNIDNPKLEDLQNGENHYIKYNFGLLIKDENKLNIQQEINKTFKFFTADEEAPEILTDSYGFITNAISSIADSNMLVNLPVTLKPQEIVEITMKHYPNSESKTTTDSSGNKITEVNLNEIAYDNLIPGHIGILKVYISPYFSSFSDVEIVSSGSGTDIVLFEQMIANVEETEYGTIYNGVYETLLSSDSQIPGGMKLQKKSFINQNNEINFDGNIYIRTLVNSFVTEANSFTLTIRAYNGNTVKTKEIVLDVQTPPSLSLSINGDKEAPVARGTEQVFNATLNGVEGNIDFSKSYMYYSNANGTEVNLGGINSVFSINQVGGVYKLTTNINLPTNRYIKIIGEVSKQINGETIVHSDTIIARVADFVIDEISVDKVVNGNITGYFNQPYSLIVRISKATYNPTISTLVKEKINLLEKQFSAYYDKDNNLTNWKVVNTAFDVSNPDRYVSLGMGYNSAKSFIIGTKVESEFGNTMVYTIQNTKFDSGDRLAATIEYLYTDNGIIPLPIRGGNGEIDKTETDKYQNNGYKFEKTFEFGFGFHRLRDEDRPDPIENLEDFKNMEDGVDYILVNDITLTDWVPFDENLKINSLDGNGYVLKLESFSLDAYTEGQELIANKNIGIFSKVNAGTTLKNIIVEIAPTINSPTVESATYDSTVVDLLVDARAYANVNFGILAGQNSGIITNSQITSNAGELRLNRELKIIENDPTNALYDDYFENNKFNKNKFIIENFNKFYPSWQDYDKETDGTPKVDKFGNLKIIDTDNTRRELSVVRIQTTTTVDVQTHYMAGLVGVNSDGGVDALGYITNSSVENITINGVGYVAGFVANNNGKISSSYFKGANIINHVAENFTQAATGGFVVFNNGSNASIQYSYIQGRIGEKTKYSNPRTGLDQSNFDHADKTGLTEDAKKDFAGYNYINAKDTSISGYKVGTAQLRALNSIISSSTLASAFVYENNALVSNSYANIMVNSSMKTSGFVFSNKVNGEISACYTLSSVKTNNMDSSPFTGRSSQYQYNNENPDGIEDCHYLKIGSGATTTADIQFAEEFMDESEPATDLGGNQFGEYNTFQGFAFNTDFEDSSYDKITRSVWFIPNGQSSDLYNDYFKNTHYLQSRPELVAANLKTISYRVWTGSEASGENSYKYISAPIGESVHNPLLIKSAEEFNRYLNYESTVDDDDRNFAIRFVSDIAFNKTDLTAQTYNMEYYGDLDGNGMTISELRLVSDTDFENPNTGETITHLGLFGKIITKPLDEENSQRGVVRNINISVDEVRGSKVTYVGALAGAIENADVFNINITGDEVIQGKNIVGGLAGIISGDSEIVNISSTLSVKSAYFKYPNRFSTLIPSELPATYGTFDIYDKVYLGESKINSETISYVGGIAGIFDVDPRDEEEVINPLSLFNAKARKLTVSGNVSLIGEIVGGVLGLNGCDSTTSDLSFIVESGSAPELLASRIAGGLIGENRGEVERSYIEHSKVLQKQIDEAYKAAVSVPSANPTVVSSNLNYNELFKGNAHYIGGAIGFNNNGIVKNSFSKINVVNLNSMFAGGFVGLSAGGKYNYCYTTGSVTGFKAVGGFAGMQVNQPFTKTGDAFGYVQVGNITFDNYIYIGATKSNALNFNAKANEDNLSLSGSASDYIGVVASNVWRTEDLITSRYKYNAEANVRIGAFVGIAVSPSSSTMDLNNLISEVSIVDRKKDETNYFNQVAIVNTDQKDDYYGDDNDLRRLMPEIGSVNNTYAYAYNANTLIKNDLRFMGLKNAGDGTGLISSHGDKKGSSVPMEAKGIMVNPAGISGYIYDKAAEGSSDTSKYYEFSRLQNIGSARTLKEIIGALYVIPTEASKMGDGFNGTVTLNAKEEIMRTRIFEHWSISRWTGVRKDTTADVNTVFPYLEAKPEATKVYVNNANDLKLMETYPNAEFILMKDINLADKTNHTDAGGNPTDLWSPIGTKAIPFRGILRSNEGHQYTIYNLKITNVTSAYVGLLGYVSEAEFYNFNLSNVNITSEATDGGGLFVGSLFGYGNMSPTIKNVNITTDKGDGAKISTPTAASVGGLAGFSGGGIIEDCTLNDVDIQIEGIGDLTKVGSDRDKALAFGGVVGMITSSAIETPVIKNTKVDGVVTLKNGTASLTIPDGSYFGGDEGRTLDVGGMVGRSNDVSSQVARITNVKSQMKLNVDLNFAGTNDEGTEISKSNIQDVNIGGLIGKSQNTCVTEERIVTDTTTKYLRNMVEGVADANTIKLSKFNGTLNYGGAIGAVYGNTLLTETDSDTFSKHEVSYLLVGQNTQVKTDLSVSEVSGDTGAKNVNVGGAVGYSGNATMSNIKSNAVINVANSKNTGIINAGGLVGNVYNGQKIFNAYSEGSINLDDAKSSTNSVNINAGGAFGNVVMSNNAGSSASEINKVVSLTNVIIKPTSVAKLTGEINVGGFAGIISNGKVSESVSNGLVAIIKGTMNDTVYAGGFVGRIELSSEIGGGITNKVEIINSYSTSDMELTSMFKNNERLHKAGLFVGAICYAYKDGKSSLTLMNNYTIGKYIYSEGTTNTFYDGLYNERVNKGGFLGGFVISEEGVTLENIEKVSNLTFLNNFYNKEFVPYANDYMTGLLVNEMLYENSQFNNTTATGFNKDGVWNVKESYPLLNWINDSSTSIDVDLTPTDANNTEGKVNDITKLTNSVAGMGISAIQSAGSKVYPSTSYTENANNKTYLITGNSTVSTEFNGKGQTLYFKNTAENISDTFKIDKLDKYSLVYGLKYNEDRTTTSGAIVTNNYGLIVNSLVENYLVNNNYGAIYKVAFGWADNLESNAVKKLVNDNRGAVDSVNATKNLTITGMVLVTTNNGNIYRSAIKNNNLSFGSAGTNSKIKSSYILTVSEGITTGTYYDSMGTSQTFNIDDTSNGNVKFDIKQMETDIASIKGFNFVDDWIIINSEGKELNYGAPMLRHELYAENSDEINSERNWVNEWVNAEGKNAESEFGTFVNPYVNKSTITIDSAAEFADISKANKGIIASRSSQISDDKVEKFNTNTSTSANLTNGIKTLITVEYVFGVKHTTIKHVFDFEGKTIQLANDIDLSGNLWTPIGEGFDNMSVNAGQSCTLNSDSHNMFKGCIEGAGFKITGVTAIQTNKNVGLFGAVYVEDGFNSFANNILIKDSNFISVSKSGGFAVAGALAGRVVIKSTANILTKVGTENANVYATNRASGLIGDILNVSGASGSDNNTYITTKMLYAYVNSNVMVSRNLTSESNNVASGLVHFGNNAKVVNNVVSPAEENAKILREMYFSGEIGDFYFDLTDITDNKFKKFVHNVDTNTDNNDRSDKYFLFANSPTNWDVNILTEAGKKAIQDTFYAVGFFDPTSMYNSSQKIDVNHLQTEALKGFTWGDVWTRMKGQNNDYPVLNAKVSYWVKESKGDDIPFDGSTYSISNAKQLAWVAEQVNMGIKTFENETVMLTANINLGGKIWSPIGYSENRSFRGTFDFNGKTISNIISSGTYIKDNSSVIGVKCVDSLNVGLLGYTLGATITSKTGFGSVGTIDDVGNITDSSKVIGNINVGGVVGFAENTDISNISNYANVTSAGGMESAATGVGGIVGNMKLSYNKSLTNLKNGGNISTSRATVGGIIGYSSSSGGNTLNIEQCINNGDIKSTMNLVGGILGKSESSVKVFINGLANWKDTTNNISSTPDNTGTITGNGYVGGIAGEIGNGSIENVTNSGNVTGLGSIGYIGGIAGNVIEGASIYEAINVGNISGKTNIGGIAGRVATGASGSSSFVNLLNKGAITATETGGIASKFIASFPGKFIENTYSAIDVGGSVDDLLFGNLAANSTDFAKHGIMNLTTMNTRLGEDTTITYDGTNFEKFTSVFKDSLVWEGVETGATANTIKLAYTNTPKGEAPTRSGSNYDVTNYNHLNYLSDLNRKRFGVSSISGQVLIKASFGIDNLVPMGRGAYPWRSSVDGGNYTLTINSIKNDSPNYSIFGSVFGATDSKTKFVKIKLLLATITTITKNGGMLIENGNNVEFDNVEIISNNRSHSINADWGGLANKLTNSSISNCTNNQSISVSGTHSNVGGLAASVKDTNITNSANKGDITTSGSGAIDNLGGIVGSATKTDSAEVEYYINGCLNTAKINCSSTVYNIGGITGNDKAYKYSHNSNGSIVYKSDDSFDYRVGLVQGKTDNSSVCVGGIIGNSVRTRIIEGNVNNSKIVGYNAGGLIGKATSTKFLNETEKTPAINNGLIKGYTVGGIIGKAENSTEIYNSENRVLGEVITSDGYSGGIVGNAKSSIITKCINRGYIASDNLYTKGTGAITGFAGYTNISDCTISGYVGVWAKTTTSGSRETNFYYETYNLDSDNRNNKTYSGNTPSGDYGKSEAKPSAKYSKISGVIEGTTLREGNANGNVVIEKELTTISIYDYYIKIETKHEGFAGWGRYYIKIWGYKSEMNINTLYSGINPSERTYGQVSGDNHKDVYYGWFYGWGANGSWISTSANFDVVDTSIIEANGDTPRYTITFKPENGGAVIEKKYYEGEQVKLPSVTKAGSTLKEWVDESNSKVNDNFTVEKNMVLTARWEDSSYTIELYDNDGKFEGEGDNRFYIYEKLGETSAKHGKPLDLSEINISREGYIIKGWYLMSTYEWNLAIDKAKEDDKNAQATLKNYVDKWDDAQKVNEKKDNLVASGYENTRVGESTTFERGSPLYSIWVAVKKVTFNLNYEGAPQPTIKEVEINTPVESWIPTRENYEFMGWYKDANCTEGNKYNFTNGVGENIEIFAKWQGVLRTVTLNYNDPNGQIGNGEISVHHGDYATRPDDPTMTGYIFKGWYYNGELFDFENTPILSDDIMLDAAWEIIKFTVTFHIGSSEEDSSVKVEYNMTVPNPKDPTREGYTFEGWYLSDDGGITLTEQFDFGTSILQDYDIYAKWEPILQDVHFKYNLGTGDVAIGDVVKVPYDSKVTKPTDPAELEVEKDGKTITYRFDDWYTDTSYETKYDFETQTITGETTIYARFIQQITLIFILRDVKVELEGGVEYEEREVEFKIDINSAFPTSELPNWENVHVTGTKYWKLTAGTVKKAIPETDPVQYEDYTVGSEISFENAIFESDATIEVAGRN